MAAPLAALCLAALQTQAALVLHWNLNESAGPTVADSSGNNHSGIATNGVVFDANGFLGGAARFDDTANQCIFTRSPGVANYPFTISVWFKNNLAANDCVAVLGTGIFDQYHALYRTGELRERVSATYTIANSPAIAVDNRWHQAVGVWESESSRFLYVDGVWRGTSSNVGVTANGVDRFGIGALYRTDTSTADIYNGWVDDAALWDEALSEEQVRILYALGALRAGEASDYVRLLAAFASGSEVPMQGNRWIPAAGLSGRIGDYGGSIAAGTAYVVLNEFGEGMMVTGGAPPAIVSFTISPMTIFAGDAATLAWNVEGPDTVTIDQGVGSVDAIGSTPVNPASATTWTLIAENGYGAATSRVSVVVLPAPPPLRLLLNWPLNEETDTTASNSVAADFTGEFFVPDGQTAPVWDSAGGFLEGALQFNNGAVAVRTGLGGVTNYPFALAAWLNTFSSENDTAVTLINSNAGDQYYSLRVVNGRATITARSGDTYDTGGPSINNGNWHYVVASFERAHVRKVYVDGELRATSSPAAVAFIPPNRFSIGGLDRASGVADAFSGTVDEAALFTGSLTENDVRILYGSQAGLHLNTAEAEGLLRAFRNGDLAVPLRDEIWGPVTGLEGGIGTTGGDLATRDAFLIMDASGNGMQILLNLAATPKPVAALRAIDVGGLTRTYLTVAMLRRVNDGMEYVVDASIDLVTWNSAGAVLEGMTDHGNGTVTVLWRSANPVSKDTPAQYLRLRRSRSQ